MEYDYGVIAINAVIAIVVALIIGTVFALLNIGEFSFLIAMLIGGAIIGFFANVNIETALVIGGIAGLFVSILQGIIAPLIFVPTTAVLFPIAGYFIALIVLGAFCCGVAALIKDVIN